MSLFLTRETFTLIPVIFTSQRGSSDILWGVIPYAEGVEVRENCLAQGHAPDSG